MASLQNKKGNLLKAPSYYYLSALPGSVLRGDECDEKYQYRYVKKSIHKTPSPDYLLVAFWPAESASQFHTDLLCLPALFQAFPEPGKEGLALFLFQTAILSNVKALP